MLSGLFVLDEDDSTEIARRQRPHSMEISQRDDWLSIEWHMITKTLQLGNLKYLPVEQVDAIGFQN